MTDVWTAPADISNGYVPTSAKWSELLGTAGNLDFLLNRGWYLAGADFTEYSRLGAVGDMSTISGLSIPAAQPILVVGSIRKSPAADTFTVGLKVNGTTVVEAASGTQTLASCSATAQTESGGFIWIITPRLAAYGCGIVALCNTRESTTGASGLATLGPNANVWASTFPSSDVTSLTLRGITGAAATGYLKDVLVYTMGVTL